MEQLKKAIELYGLMAERCARSGFSPHQAAVYDEMTRFISGCADIEEATDAIKNSKYYLAPTEALVRDKIEAERRAAVELEMPEIVEVYDRKLQAIDADQGEMYTAGFQQTAQNIRNEYILTMQAFGEIFRAWFCFKIRNQETYIDEIRTNLGRLKRPTSDFASLAEVEIFRKILPCSDSGYQMFVREMKELISGGLQNSKTCALRSTEEPEDEDPEAAWETIRNCRTEVRRAGERAEKYTPQPEKTVTGTKDGYR